MVALKWCFVFFCSSDSSSPPPTRQFLAFCYKPCSFLSLLCICLCYEWKNSSFPPSDTYNFVPSQCCNVKDLILESLVTSRDWWPPWGCMLSSGCLSRVSVHNFDQIFLNSSWLECIISTWFCERLAFKLLGCLHICMFFAFCSVMTSWNLEV